MASNTAALLFSIAQFGDKLSQILHHYDTVEAPANRNMPEFFMHLAASVHVLNQLGKVFEEQAALPDGKEPLINSEGIEYVNTLAEESSVALCRVLTLLDAENRRGRFMSGPRKWKSNVSVENGQKIFNAPKLDENEMFQQLKEVKWYNYGVNTVLDEVCDRLEEVHRLLLLFSQVITARELTFKTSTNGLDMKSIVQCHRNILRTADMALVNPRYDSRSRSRSSSLYSSSGSDSDSSFDSRRRSRSRPRPFKRTPFPPPPPLPAACPPAPPMLRPTESISRVVDVSCDLLDSTPSFQHYTSVPSPPTQDSQLKPSVEHINIATEETETPKEVPPSYSEADTKKGEILNLTEKKDGSASLSSSTTGVGSTRGNETTEKESVLPDKKKSDSVLNSTGKFGIKFKSLFRSKSYLETQMKQELTENNASLNAHLIQDFKSYEIPHSTLHSTEYTHMRTIISQSKDNNWFKTFAELSDIERQTLARLTGPKRIESKSGNETWQNNELVVLKIHNQQQTNGNAWLRALELIVNRGYASTGSEFDDDSRVILAITRSTPCAAPLDPPAKEDTYVRSRDPDIYPRSRGLPPPPPPPSAWPAAHPFPGVNDSAMRPPPPPGVSMYPPPPPNQYPGVGRQPSPTPPRTPRTDAEAVEKLTTYKSFTIRPLPSLPTSTKTTPPATPTAPWTRCTITSEGETQSNLATRIAAFQQRGDSVIDLKMQLTAPQSAQLSRLLWDEAHKDWDKRFAYKVVELSMMDREKGLVKRQTGRVEVNVIHLVLQRRLRSEIRALNLWRGMNGVPMAGSPGVVHVGPPPPPQLGPKFGDGRPIKIFEDRRRRSRSRSPIRGGRKGWTRAVSPGYSSYSSSSGESGSDTDSDSDSGHERKKVVHVKGRWQCGKNPLRVEWKKKDKKRDLVELLLERWTMVGVKKLNEEQGNDEAEGEKGREKEKKKGKGKGRKMTYGKVKRGKYI